MLRPFFVAILGAFVAAAPVAPIPWRVKKERKGPSDGGQARGHHQKLEEPERRAPADAGRASAHVAVAAGDERGPAPAGDALPPSGDGARRPRDVPTPTARPAPTPLGAVPRRAADLRAGLLALPPPAPRLA